MRSNQMTLSSLAILKVDLDEGRGDYLSYFENFVISLLTQHEIDPVTDTEIAKLFETDFGLRIPQRAVQLVLRRLAKKNFLQREHNTYRVAGELPTVDLSAKRESAQRDIEGVYDALREFAKRKFSLDWSDEQLDGAVFGFLNGFGVDCIRAYVYRTALPEVPEGGERNQYVVSKFINEMYHDKSPIFESVIVLVKGLMYANALNCPDLESIEKDFRRVAFYVDTPLIFDVLGINGEAKRAATLELTTLLEKLKGTVAIFDHTLDEVDLVLDYAEKNIESPKAEGRIIYSMRARKMKRGDIVLLREHLQEEIESVGIKVLRTPKYKKEHQVGERALEESLKDKVRYFSSGGVRYDVNSVRSIFVLRDGQVPLRLEDTKAVFVTDNEAFAQTAFEHGKNHNSTKEVSPVITDFSLVNVAWLKAPLGAPALPEKKTLAACYAGMEPRASLWGKYLSELNAMEAKGQITPDDHVVLRLSGIAIDELMDMTLGDEAAFDGSTVSQILERVKESHRAESIEALVAEERAHAKTRDEKETVERKEEHITAKMYWFSNKISRAVLYTLSFIGITALVVSSIASLNFTSAWIAQSEVVTSLANGGIFLGVIWAVYSGYTGHSIRGISRQIQSQIQNRIFKKLKKWMLGE